MVARRGIGIALKIMNALQSAGKLRYGQLKKRMRVSDNTLMKYLSYLMSEGLVLREGRGGRAGIAYSLTLTGASYVNSPGFSKSLKFVVGMPPW